MICVLIATPMISSTTVMTAFTRKNCQNSARRARPENPT